MKHVRRSGFTLVEILIVAVIMGILASIVIPQFTQSSDDARYSATLQDLQTLRSQIDLYRNQHENRYPGDTKSSDGSAGGDGTDFAKQLTEPTNESGKTGAFGDPDYPFGPYFHNQVPANPFNALRDVTVDSPTTADDASGWVFEKTAGRIRINHAGKIPGDKTTDYWAL